MKSYVDRQTRQTCSTVREETHFIVILNDRYFKIEGNERPPLTPKVIRLNRTNFRFYIKILANCPSPQREVTPLIRSLFSFRKGWPYKRGITV